MISSLNFQIKDLMNKFYTKRIDINVFRNFDPTVNYSQDSGRVETKTKKNSFSFGQDQAPSDSSSFFIFYLVFNYPNSQLPFSWKIIFQQFIMIKSLADSIHFPLYLTKMERTFYTCIYICIGAFADPEMENFLLD